MSVSGLSAPHRARARELAVKAAHLGYVNRDAMHYTEGGSRWQGIQTNRKAWRGEFPNYADCSAFVTWCLWNGLDHYGVRDVVNGLAWRAGFTGTMLNHGRPVHGHLLHADAVLYGNPFGATGHTAIYVGGGMVISFGGEIGPLLLPMYYRPVTAIRRYV